MYAGKYKAIIFDLDGTLLNTLEDIGDSMNSVLESRNYPTHDMDKYRYFVGSGVRVLADRVLPEDKRNDDNIDECVKEFKEVYSKNWKNKSKPYDGVPETLDRITAIGLKVAILSNKPDEFVKLCVDELLASWNFKKVIGLSDRTPPKPNPKGALEIAESFKIGPAYFIYVGDTSIDMKTANSAGMFPVGALWGFRAKEELLESGAKALLERPLDILNFLL